FGVELSEVSGTGEKGRILKEDVQLFVKERLNGSQASGLAGSGLAGSGSGIPPIPVVDFAKFGAIDVQPLGRTRAAGAANLHRSWLNLPHVTNHDEADITDLELFRESLKPAAERRGVKVTPLAFIVKACASLMGEFPTMNASLDAAVENFILKRYVNIGIAVDTPNGLVVPVINDADKKGIWALSEEIIDLADRARERKLKPAEMQGGTFSVSSLGAIGGTGFTPIINAPEVAILGVGRMATRPQWDGATFQPRSMVPLSLSYDHRAINGAEAGAYLARLREVLADFRQVVL
ncbi:MAG: 2-oxo acid dehydrogenase subunit E2, partial [Pseudomonadota bacterium]